MDDDAAGGPTVPPPRVAIVGGGTMGAGIAGAFAAAGSVVTVAESDSGAAGHAAGRIAASVRRAAERGLVDDPAGALAAIDCVDGIAALPGDADLVIEAVPEDPALKARVLAAVEARVPATTVIATNTSSIAVGELAAALTCPDRFVGMHFFNPVPASKLVEVVVGASTSSAVRDRAVDWAERLGKTAIVVRDSPGFATSRLGVVLGLEAVRMLADGVADAADIDRALMLGYGHPVGPLRLTDLVGLDVRLSIAGYLRDRLGERFAPPQLLRDKVARGELGRKTGRGFYRW